MPIPVAPVVVRTSIAYTQRYFSIGDILMSTGSGTIDDNGVRWVLESITGWDGAPATTGDSAQRSADHGVWLGSAYYGPRLIEVVGSVQTDWETGNDCITQLAAAVPISDTAVAKIGGAGPDLQAEVRMNGELLVTGSQNVTRFSLSLIAPDPRRYGDEVTESTGLPLTTGGLTVPMTVPLSMPAVTSSGRLTVTNAGNMATRPVFAVTGPCPPFTITQTSTGRRLSALEAVDPGRVLYLDTDQRMALLDGTSLRVVTGTWFEIEPGDNDIQFSSASYDANASLSVTFRSAWR